MNVRIWVIGVFLSVATGAVACCALTYALKTVMFVGQRNVIVWDETTKTEHFIRNAKFASNADNLGFIAPSPSVPKLEEVDAKAFESLAAAVDSFKAKVKKNTLTLFRPKEEAAAGAVQVIQEVKVAGYVATTLKANDPKALADWMKKNGYVTTPGTQVWTDFYIKKGWLLTAFKVDSGLGSGETGLVKMSFTTDRPFNPYYVPKENFPSASEENEGLLLYFVGNGKYSPEKGPSDLKQTAAAPLDGRFATDVVSHLKLASLPKDATITVFEDHKFPVSTPGDDVFFERTGDQPSVPISQNLIFSVVCIGSVVLAIAAIIRSLVKFSRSTRE